MRAILLCLCAEKERDLEGLASSALACLVNLSMRDGEYKLQFQPLLDPLWTFPEARGCEAERPKQNRLALFRKQTNHETV